MAYPTQKLDKSWIQDGITNETVEWAKSFGEFLQSEVIGGAKGLSTSQIRRFFSEMKKIQSDPEKYKDDIPLLKAKLAYAVGREITVFKGVTKCKSKIKEFYEEIERGINYIRMGNKSDTINFVKIIEAIVAYHKFYGGK